MKFFVDTADVDAIRELHEIGLLDGVTTNPSLVAKSGRDFKDVVREICELLPGLPVSAEVAATDFDGMMAEGRVLAGLSDWRLSIFGSRLFLLRMPDRYQTLAVRSFVDFIAEKAQSLRD